MSGRVNSFVFRADRGPARASRIVGERGRVKEFGKSTARIRIGPPPIPNPKPKEQEDASTENLIEEGCCFWCQYHILGEPYEKNYCDIRCYELDN